MSGSAPALHIVTDDAVLARPDFVPTAARLLEIGGPATALHVRGPSTHAGALFGLVGSLTEVARASGALLVVNDRIDVALAAGAGGVQLGRRSLPLASARAVLRDDMEVGVSTHTDGEAAEAAAGGADWIFAGTIYPSESHPGLAGRGSEAIAGAVRASAVPVLAIGGVTPERVAELRGAGAHGVAVIRGIWEAASPDEALSRYLQALREGP